MVTYLCALCAVSLIGVMVRLSPESMHINVIPSEILLVNV